MKETKEFHKSQEKIIRIPAIALRDITVMPDMIINFDLSRAKSIFAVEQAMMDDQKIFLIAQKEPEVNEPGREDLYSVGTLAFIRKISKVSDKLIRVLVEGTARAGLIRFAEDTADYLLAEVEEIPEPVKLPEENLEEAMKREIQALCSEYGKVNAKASKTLGELVRGDMPLGKLLDEIIMNIPVDYKKRQEVLNAVPIEERFRITTTILGNELEILKLRVQLGAQIKGRIEKNQKEYILREQLNYIRQELGDDKSFSDADQFEKDLKKLKAGKEIKERIAKEISRFKSLNVSSSESSVERAYIETLLELPWDKASKDDTDLKHAERILDEQHYGLKQVKERVLEFLAVRSFTKKGASPILCLVGPPGTGKTSIARSVAEALGKKYVRICLGGVRDEAEIRGHRKTYVGAMPGRIVNGLKQAGVKNPLMLLDEIDKVSSDYKGDTSAALLEVLDSEQNVHFRDHYVELPVDLSEVLFIATANNASEIPRPLLDRMEMIEVTSYTANEKFHIAREHLVRKQLSKNGLTESQLSVSDGALKNMIQYYTREAGVRELERRISELCRKTARQLLEQKEKAGTPIRITAGTLTKYLGKEKYRQDKANEKDETGIVRGLAWTSVGGDTLQIEVNKMPGKGEIELTGQMGDVMKESALTGLSYVRSVSGKYRIAPETYKENDFHIHIPEGAVPKDGPSAGITMATALFSAITEIPVHADLAMTGEITLRGRVLPVGGLKEKILAAKMAGIKKILAPAKNRKDVEEISKEITGGLEIVFVENMEEVLKQACDMQGD